MCSSVRLTESVQKNTRQRNTSRAPYTVYSSPCTALLALAGSPEGNRARRTDVSGPPNIRRRSLPILRKIAHRTHCTYGISALASCPARRNAPPRRAAAAAEAFHRRRRSVLFRRHASATPVASRRAAGGAMTSSGATRPLFRLNLGASAECRRHNPRAWKVHKDVWLDVDEKRGSAPPTRPLAAPAATRLRTRHARQARQQIASATLHRLIEGDPGLDRPHRNHGVGTCGGGGGCRMPQREPPGRPCSPRRAQLAFGLGHTDGAGSDWREAAPRGRGDHRGARCQAGGGGDRAERRAAGRRQARRAAQGRAAPG